MSFDRALYALRIAQNQAAINYSNNTPEGSASLINNTILPGGGNFLQASVSDLQNTLATIGNPDNYNSNRQQNQPSTDQIQARISSLQSQQPTIPRAIGIADKIQSTSSSPVTTSLKLPNLSNISPVLLVAGVGLLILILR